MPKIQLARKALGRESDLVIAKILILWLTELLILIQPYTMEIVIHTQLRGTEDSYRSIFLFDCDVNSVTVIRIIIKLFPCPSCSLPRQNNQIFATNRSIEFKEVFPQQIGDMLKTLNTICSPSISILPCDAKFSDERTRDSIFQSKGKEC